MKQLGRNAPKSCTMQKVKARMLIEYIIHGIRMDNSETGTSLNK